MGYNGGGARVARELREVVDTTPSRLDVVLGQLQQLLGPSAAAAEPDVAAAVLTDHVAELEAEVAELGRDLTDKAVEALELAAHLATAQAAVEAAETQMAELRAALLLSAEEPVSTWHSLSVRSSLLRVAPPVAAYAARVAVTGAVAAALIRSGWTNLGLALASPTRVLGSALRVVVVCGRSALIASRGPGIAACEAGQRAWTSGLAGQAVLLLACALSFAFLAVRSAREAGLVVSLGKRPHGFGQGIAHAVRSASPPFTVLLLSCLLLSLEQGSGSVPTLGWWLRGLTSPRALAASALAVATGYVTSDALDGAEWEEEGRWEPPEGEEGRRDSLLAPPLRSAALALTLLHAILELRNAEGDGLRTLPEEAVLSLLSFWALFTLYSLRAAMLDSARFARARLRLLRALSFSRVPPGQPGRLLRGPADGAGPLLGRLRARQARADGRVALALVSPAVVGVAVAILSWAGTASADSARLWLTGAAVALLAGAGA